MYGISYFSMIHTLSYNYSMIISTYYYTKKNNANKHTHVFLKKEKNNCHSTYTEREKKVFSPVIILKERKKKLYTTHELSSTSEISVSKLETLPNEILIDIFEKYINGVDIFVAFLHQQNRRFDALISQCQRFYFNFLHCQKDYFRFSIGLLPVFIEKIEELALSDQHAPGQIYAFFQFFPSFIPFKRLRKLYIHLNTEALEWSTTQNALLSLSNTIVDTVLIKVINLDGMQTLNQMIAEIFRLITVKRFFLICDSEPSRPDYFQTREWDFLTGISSKIEYLTMSIMSCQFIHLQSIFQCLPQLKYFNVRLTSREMYGLYHSTISSTNNIILMPTLHTLILSFDHDDPTTFDMLAKYLKAMPALRHLEIQAHTALLEANAWEAILQTSLPLLTHFILKTTTSRIQIGDIETILSSFETPFWTSKQNFYLIITQYKVFNNNEFGLDEIQRTNDQNEFNQPVIKWWIVPIHTRIDNIPTRKINTFGLDMANSLSQYHYFNNVKNLIVYNLDDKLLEWLITYVNCSQIKYLDVSSLNDKSISVSSLLSNIKTITSLRIEYKQLIAHRDVYLGKKNSLQSLDISVNTHSLEKKDIINISTLFPNIEHLRINTMKLSNIPLLKAYLRYLSSLTYKIPDTNVSSLDNYQQKLWDDRLRKQVQFLFQRQSDWITIWTDQAALKESYWQTFNSDLPWRDNTTVKRRFDYSD